MKKLNSVFFDRKIWLVIIIIALLLYQFGLFKPKSKIIIYNIEDECGMTVKTQIHHSIPQDSICLAECINFCGTLEKDYYNHIFKEMAASCNECECQCR